MNNHWPPGALRILLVLDDAWASPLELARRARVSADELGVALDFLVSNGWCESRLVARGAEFSLASMSRNPTNELELVVICLKRGESLDDIAGRLCMDLEVVMSILGPSELDMAHIPLRSSGVERAAIPDRKLRHSAELASAREVEVGEIQSHAGGAVSGPHAAEACSDLVQLASARGFRFSPDAFIRLFQALDSVPRPRADLLMRANVGVEHWRSAIEALVGLGVVVREGRKRGATYTRVGGAPSGRLGLVEGDGGSCCPESVVVSSLRSSPAASRPVVVDAYHDLVDELLGELVEDDGDNGCGDAVVVEEAPSWVSAVSDSGFEWSDMRQRGGCLWVVDGPGVGAFMESIRVRWGVAFVRASSSRACGGRAAWWTRDEA